MVKMAKAILSKRDLIQRKKVFNIWNNMRKKILILGGDGNGSVIANAILDANNRGYNEWICEGYLNDRYPIGAMIDSFEVRGSIKNDLQKIY